LVFNIFQELQVKAGARDHLELLTCVSNELEGKLDESGLAWLQTTVGHCQGRLDNLKAGLQVWHDCLSRILSCWAELEKKLESPKEVIRSARDFLDSTALVPGQKETVMKIKVHRCLIQV
jgi:hypothetical protein